MSNVIQLNARLCLEEARKADLISCFANHRRDVDDVFWLKENAELLNILECTQASVSEQDLAPYLEFYDQIEDRLEFFPQYYRFLLSICLDLEDLGMEGHKGEALAHWIARAGLAEAELSDLQRAEARRLLTRRGVSMSDDDGTTERLHAFIDRSDTFVMPNKKAAYELTHILFYLSEYGRRDPQVSAQALVSLEYAGLLAYLEQNADLLAEICIALRYAGVTPPLIWENWLEQETCGFGVDADFGGRGDAYHDYFVCNWAMAVAGKPNFSKPVPAQGGAFYRPPAWPAPLREMSACLFQMGAARSDDWQKMRPRIEATLSAVGHDILVEAEQSTLRFDDFFAGFARTNLRPSPCQAAL